MTDLETKAGHDDLTAIQRAGMPIIQMDFVIRVALVLPYRQSQLVRAIELSTGLLDDDCHHCRLR
jgi:hypothetical protein